MLLDAGADVTSAYPDCAIPLRVAVLGQFPDVVRVLLASGKVDPNSRLPGGMTALHLASGIGNEEIVELLISHGHVMSVLRFISPNYSCLSCV